MKSFQRECLFVMAFILAGLTPGFASAQSISIHEVQTMTFPTLATAAGGGNVTVTLNPLNSATSGSGQIIGGMASRGQYALSLTSGGTPVSISLDISGVSTGNAGLTLDAFRGFYKGQTISSFPSSTLPLPATSPSNTPLYLGATVTALPSVTPGTYSASFSITVFVQ